MAHDEQLPSSKISSVKTEKQQKVAACILEEPSLSLTGIKTDIVILFFLFVCCSFLAIYFDLFERISILAEQHEKYEIDEFVIVFSFFSFFLLLFSFRRIMEMRNLLQRRDRYQDDLQEINYELNRKTMELEEQRQKSVRLSQLVTYLQACTNSEEAFGFIADAAVYLFPDCSGAMYMMRNSRDHLQRKFAWGQGAFPDEFLPTDCWALRLGREYITYGNWHSPLCEHVDKACSDVSVCVPLTAHGEITGLLYIQMPPSCIVSGEQKIRALLQQFVTLFSEHVSLALSNMALHEKLHDLAIHDALTGLYNRQYLQDTFDRELHRAARSNNGLGVLMFDVDHFKNFNDNFGHSAGDHVLMTVGNYLGQFFRTEDFCCRYGGEEFLVLLHDVAREEVFARCDRFRLNVERLHLVWQNMDLGHVTVSVGVALYPEHGETRDVLIDAADRALYQAKDLGRNRVCFAGGYDGVLKGEL